MKLFIIQHICFYYHIFILYCKKIMVETKVMIEAPIKGWIDILFDLDNI